MPNSELQEQVHTRIGEFFERDGAVFGRDLAPYRGHAQRVAGLTMGQVEMRPEWVEPVAVAAYYHDAAHGQVLNCGVTRVTRPEPGRGLRRARGRGGRSRSVRPH